MTNLLSIKPDILTLEGYMKKILAVLVIMLMLSPLHAAVYHFFNGERLAEAAFEWEQSQSNPKDSDLLLVSNFAGYVGALFDHLSEKQHICAPDDITKNQVLGVISDYLKNNRSGLKNAGSVIVEDALYKQYSCTK